MRFLLKFILLLAMLGAVALVGYALFFELPSPGRDITVPVAPR